MAFSSPPHATIFSSELCVRPGKPPPPLPLDNLQPLPLQLMDARRTPAHRRVAALTERHPTGNGLHVTCMLSGTCMHVDQNVHVACMIHACQVQD